jgi:hypothetical protein
MNLPSSITPDQLVARPERGDHTISPWLDEQIWGHRIYTQSPWLIFLEFTGVAEACQRRHGLFVENSAHYPLEYIPRQRMMLRNILWNNESIRLTDQENPDSETAWNKWLASMRKTAQGVSIATRDFSYLKPRFKSFREFATLVQMLQRDAAVEGDSNKRWTSRFVFPFGPNALYEDLNIKNNTLSREYINFGRTGELLYLMLSRSAAAPQLKPWLAGWLSGDNNWNRLLGLLQPGDPEHVTLKGKSYLPYRYHSRFDDLGQDWLRIFELQLPGFDQVEHLVCLGALHVLLYQLTVAAQWARDTPGHLHFICEIIAPKKTLARQQSILNYQDNNVLTTKAIDAYLSRIEKSAEWQAALNESASPGETFTRCRNILAEEVWWGSKKEYEGERSPAKLLRSLREFALVRHRRVVANVHRIYGREIGLVSRRGTNRFRYAPSDGLLKTLLLANVQKRMELREFLQVLFQRYGLVFGPEEAKQVLSGADFDQGAFSANSARLEQRLISLGLLRRLSDGCAYVINPYAR